MEKRGQLVYKALLVIIASAIVITTFVSTGKSYGSQEAFYKLAIAKDLALTLDLMYALPGDLSYIYPNGVSLYDIEIKDNLIKVYDHATGKLDPNIAMYRFVGIESDKLNTIVKAKKYVKLEKINENIKISGVDEW